MPTTAPIVSATTKQSRETERAAFQLPAPKCWPTRTCVALVSPYIGAVSQKKAISIAECVAIGTWPRWPASAPTPCSCSSSSSAATICGSICERNSDTRCRRSASRHAALGSRGPLHRRTSSSRPSCATRVSVVASGEPSKPRPAHEPAPCTRSRFRPRLRPNVTT
eukprot:7314060-Prymnesium_polylepis.1